MLKKFMGSALAMLLAITMISCSSTETATKKEEKKVAEKSIEKSTNPKYEITVTQKGKELGKIVLELWPNVAPKHCANFDNLVKTGFYDGTAFHRVIPGFMIQGGDPNSKNKPRNTWGMGDPSQKTVPAEFSDISHKRGILSTARKGGDINSATSQFFIMVEDSPHLDRQYTVFGHVLSGMDVADKVVNSRVDKKNGPLDKIEMKIVKLND